LHTPESTMYGTARLSLACFLILVTISEVMLRNSTPRPNGMDLYEGLSDPILQDWKDIVNLQKHWIGEPNGVRFEFQILPQPEGTSNSAPTADTLSIWLPEDTIEDVAKSQGQYITVKSSHILASKTVRSGTVLPPPPNHI
ncbi:uncharacterized protein LOC113472124, partial [Diaphorina citri]|uniref:Uncharacterized protein LOC113472124 n=1 Tax=Diaphorina citri TaxID=121845 RepID=A0A3Q0JGL3_DIACI